MPGAEELTVLGERLYREGKTEAALSTLLEALAVLPSHARAHSNVGVIYWGLGQRQESLQHLEQAVALDQADPIIVLNCADVYRAANRAARAAEICQNFLKRHGEEQSVRQYLEALQSANLSAANDLQRQREVGSNSSQEPLVDAATVINYAIESRGYAKYLEIGCRDDETFKQIEAAYKVGIDPVSGGTHRMTSDQFFELSDDTFDIVFVDGLHYAEQVYKDVQNSLRCLREGGLIVLHDCRPSEEVHQLRQAKTYVWNGDVWKAFVHFRSEANVDAITGDFDHGIGLIQKGQNPAPLKLEKDYRELSWIEYQQHKQSWLRLANQEEVKAWLQQ